MSISLYDSYAQTFSKKIIGNFIQFPVVRQVNLTIIKNCLINGVSKSCFVKSIEISKQENLVIGFSINITRCFYLNLSLRKSTGYIRANDIHATKVFDRSNSYYNNFFLSHLFCTVCKVNADNSWQ